MDAVLLEDEQSKTRWFRSLFVVLGAIASLGALTFFLRPAISTYTWLCPTCQYVIEQNEIAEE